MTYVTNGAGTVFPSGTPKFTFDFSGVHFARSLVLYVYFVNRFFVLFDGLLLTIVLSVFLRFTDSDFPLASSNSSYLIFISILLCTLLYSVILI